MREVDAIDMRSNAIRLCFLVGQMVRANVSSLIHQKTHMFVQRSRIPKTLVPGVQKPMSFACRSLVAAVSTVGAVALLFWSRYASENALSLNLVEDNVSARSLSNDANGFGIRQASNGSMEESIEFDHCRVTACKTVSCSSISRVKDPGTVASNFIETRFKADCKEVESVILTFDNCQFPANTLRRNWLRTTLSIEELTFNGCFLVDIEDDAFSLSIYESTKKITLAKNKLLSLRSGMFRQLATLAHLTIQENTIVHAELNSLRHVADSLTILELYRAINDREVLRNITGGSTLLHLEILSLQGNSIPTIDSELFTGVPTVKSLYLADSNVRTVSRNTFEPMASSIQQLILSNNNILSLPNGLLDRILLSKRPFHLAIHNNPWHCDCDLKWIQDLIQSHSDIVTNVPTCSGPKTNAGKSFKSANFCYENTTSVPSSPTTSTVSPESTRHDRNQTTTPRPPEPAGGTVNAVCDAAHAFTRNANSRHLLSTDILEFQPRLPKFYVSKHLDQAILVNLPDLKQRLTLVWFDNDDVERSLGCAKDVKHAYLVRDIDPQTAYTICLLADNEANVSPLNCLAVTSWPAYESRAWLTNADKSLVYSLSALSLALLFLLGGFLSFLLIRRHPTLLRGSKRVMLVKRRNVEALVLPKGVDVNDDSRGQGSEPFRGKLHEDGYITPLPPVETPPPRRPRAYSLSCQSDGHSYVSEVDTLRDSWGTKRKLEAPPLPPHPHEPVPSLSVAVDSTDEYHYQSCIV